MSGASNQATGRLSGLVLTSRFLVVPNHSVLSVKCLSCVCTMLQRCCYECFPSPRLTFPKSGAGQPGDSRLFIFLRFHFFIGSVFIRIWFPVCFRLKIFNFEVCCYLAPWSASYELRSRRGAASMRSPTYIF